MFHNHKSPFEGLAVWFSLAKGKDYVFFSIVHNMYLIFAVLCLVNSTLFQFELLQETSIPKLL